MTLLRFVLQNVVRRKLRFSLSVLGIAVATASILSILTLTEELVSSHTDMVNRFGGELIIVERRVADPVTSEIDDSLIPLLEEHPDIVAAHGFLFDFASIEEEDLASVQIFGRSSSDPYFNQLSFPAGQSFSPTDQGVVIIGESLAARIEKGEGDQLELVGEDFRISGVFRSSNVFENGAILMPLEALQSLMLRQSVLTAATVSLTPDKPVEKTAEVVKEFVRSLTYEDGRSRDLIAVTTEGFAERSFQLQLIQPIAWAIAFVGLVMGGLGMLNTMSMSVVERAREFGLLRSLGWKRWQIAATVIPEGLALCVAGAALGSVFGAVILRMIAQNPDLSSFIGGNISRSSLGSTWILVLGAGIIASLWPAIYASRLEPIEALRRVW